MAYYSVCQRPSRQMHSFPRFPMGNYAPLFRLFDEEVQSTLSRPIRQWQPRFDVREVQDSYQLQGELPGLDSKDVQIEFADENTLVIRGRTVRESSSGTKPEAIEESAENQDQKAVADDAASETGSTSSYQKPTVEDEYVDVSENEKPAATTESTVATADKAEPQPKYWVSERSVGEFHRSFTFPGHVNQEAVTASLKNGILSVVIPKAVAKEPRKITIQ